MTNKPREHVQNFSRQEKVLIFDGRSGISGEAAEAKSIQMSDVQQNLWKTLWYAAAHQQQVDKHSQFLEQSRQERKLEDIGTCLSNDRQIDKGQVNEETAAEGDSDHLLILAQSAELMLESDESFDRLHMFHENKEDKQSSQGEFDTIPVISHVQNEKKGFFCKGKTPRLSQIRCLARSKRKLSAQQTMWDIATQHLHGRRIRLTQIRRLVRSESHSQVHNRTDQKNGMNSERQKILLSQLRRLARSKSNSLVQEAIQKRMHGIHVNQTLKMTKGLGSSQRYLEKTACKWVNTKH